MCLFLIFFVFTHKYLDSLVPLLPPAIHRRNSMGRKVFPESRGLEVHGIPAAGTILIRGAIPGLINLVRDCLVVDPLGEVTALTLTSLDPVNVAVLVGKLDSFSGGDSGKQKDNGLERHHIENVHTLSRVRKRGYNVCQKVHIDH